MSNFTDVDALAAEPGVCVRYTRSPADIERADLVVLPGTKATVEDLKRLRADGLDRALLSARARSSASAAATRCSATGSRTGSRAAGQRDGLGLLAVNTTLRAREAPPPGPAAPSGRRPPPATRSATAASTATSRSSRTATCSAPPGTACSRATRSAASCSAGSPSAAAARWTPGTTRVPAVREAHLDRLADWFGAHVDAPALTDLIQQGAPEGLPTIPPGGPRAPSLDHGRHRDPRRGARASRSSAPTSPRSAARTRARSRTSTRSSAARGSSWCACWAAAARGRRA